ncbi:MAG: hypothetical protein IT338_09110 [Thermomicrobiales bacterium]|nr:hypothetical protein [Thermomicrobiales bacterium]
MLIRPWAEPDQLSVASLVGREASTSPQLEVHGPDQDRPRPFSRTLVAIDQGAILGVGTLWENALHPARWRVTLHGQRGFWTEGSAAALLAQLRALRPDHRLLQTAMSALDASGREFVQQHGFAPLMRTRRGVLGPAAVPRPLAAEVDAAETRVAAAGYRVAPLAGLEGVQIPGDTLAHLHAELYRLGHQWDPVRPLSDEEATALFLDRRELLPEAMYLALAEKRPVAVASLRRSETSPHVELAWAGALPATTAHEGDLVVALVGRCLRHASAATWPVLCEVDEADTHLWRLLDRLPVEYEPDWLTFAELPCRSTA